MSFLVAGCALLLALLAGIVLDDVSRVAASATQRPLL